MSGLLKLDEPFAVLSETERSRTAAHVLKHGDTFAVFDEHGDIMCGRGCEHGLYHAGTRFLSKLELLLGRRQPLLLSSTISDDNTVFTADLTNSDVLAGGSVVLPRGTLHVFRSRVLHDGTWAECIRVTNHGLEPVEVTLSIRFEADFCDVFEVRGTRRVRRGDLLPPQGGNEPVLRYRGLDGVERRTRIRPLRTPTRCEDDGLYFALPLEPHGWSEVHISIGCEIGSKTRELRGHAETTARLRRETSAREEQACRVVSSNQAFNAWFQRSTADLHMMITDTPSGPYPYAGIPWYSTPFGRDGLITALQLLWAAPEVARGVLSFLADTQATTVNDAQDAQPGKILHEMREGEMAALGEIPFGRYYGTADATPLFVGLAQAYLERTGDAAFIDHLWPHVLAALEWMDKYGDVDGDGFIEYARRNENGLLQQGWKDSWDSVFHADGTIAEAPIALCEVQGYAYAAWKGAARMAAARGETARAEEWRQRAAALRMRFEERFWCEDLGTYALALDAAKRPCRVRTSNPGHCLLSGLVNRSRAGQLAGTLMAESSFGGWGIRTVAAGAPRYNPMSYHNGSVWPHDTAIVAAGLARYGFTGAASRLFNATFDLSRSVTLHRLPELICGFHRRTGDSPTLYPVACAPQAWAAGAVYLLLQACLGMHIDASVPRVSFNRAVLPESIDWLRVIGLRIGEARLDLLLTRHEYDVGVTVLRREGDVEVVAVK